MGMALLLGLEPRRRRWCSAWRCRWRARWCCCARSRTAACSNRSTAASRSAGWSSKTWRWCWCWCCCRRWRGMLGGSAPDGSGRRRRLWHDARHHAAARSAAFVALMLVVGRRVFPWLLWQVARTGSRELFTLCVVAAAVGIAYGVGRAVRRVVRAGRVLRRHGAARVRAQPPRRRGVAAAARRVRGAVLRLGRHAVRPGGAGRASRCRCWRWSAIIMVGKSLAAVGAGAGVPLSAEHRADGVGAAWRRSASSRSSWPALGVSLGLLPAEGQSLILAGALISIALNPLLFSRDRAAAALAARALRRWRAGWSAATTRWPSCR